MKSGAPFYVHSPPSNTQMRELGDRLTDVTNPLASQGDFVSRAERI